jgi:NAD-dependent DNA ligase
MNTSEEIMQAHQYLYYCLGRPILSDWEYDMFCRDNELDGKGGSDLESSYSDKVKELALKFLK